METTQPTANDLAKYVNADAIQDATYLTACLDQASEIVNKMSTGATVPPAITHRAILETGADLYMRQHARTGYTTFETDLGLPEPYPSRTDPKTTARIILQPWLPPAIG